MNKRNLPPQAYTRETLVKAFEWLKTQPESVRSVATEADSLVTLYMQSRRANNLPPLKTNQDFKADLKNLAAGLKKFEDEDPMMPSPTQTIPEVKPLLDLTQDAGVWPKTAAPQKTTEKPTASPKLKTEIFESVMEPTQPSSTPRPAPKRTPQNPFDVHSKKLIEDAKKRLNLSQDSEVVRLLLVLGSEKLKQVLPPQ